LRREQRRLLQSQSVSDPAGHRAGFLIDCSSMIARVAAALQLWCETTDRRAPTRPLAA
jgi:hypothetical protein